MLMAFSESLLLYLSVTLLAFVLLVLLERPRSRNGLPLPPGPKPWPVIGNLLDFPKDKAWLTYQSWSDQYGDVVYAEALGQKLVILGTAEATSDLFERRGAVYSNRFRPIMGPELMDFKWMITLWDNDDALRQARKTLHAHLNPGAIKSHHPVQIDAARRLARDLISAPEGPSNVSGTVRFNFAQSIVKMTYGLDVPDPESEYMTGPERVLEAINLSVLPGRFLVDYIPWLRYVPEWMPGAGFQKIAHETRELHQRARNVPFEAVKAAMAQGTASESILRSILEERQTKDCDIPIPSKDEQFIKDLTGIIYLGAVDTTVSAVITFILAMVLHPDVQAKGQAEIDRVVGQDRLPEMSDRDQLPYVNAIVDECYRWVPVAPLAAPHVPTHDDVYRGYLIPKGTIVLSSVWAILHNSDNYPESDLFQPERYLVKQDNGSYIRNENVRDPKSVAFGFGRRICPGRFVADASLFASVISLLASVTFHCAQDAEGMDIIPKVETSSGFITHPEDFPYAARYRSEKARLSLLGEHALES